jgi:hypothetical protein
VSIPGVLRANRVLKAILSPYSFLHCREPVALSVLTPLLVSLTGVFENLEDLGYKGLAFLGREIPGVNGLLVGLKVAELGLLGQVAVYEAHYGVDLFAGKAVAAAG